MAITEDDDACLSRLQGLVDSHPDDPSHHFNLGLFLWSKCENSKEIKEKAAEHFVISVKLNPQNAAAFRYLGHYYSGVSVDIQRALKCYQRAVSVNPDDSESGEALCDLLDKGGKESLQCALCREASEKSPRAFWAFQRLGYIQVHQKKWSEAVQSLQHAIRGCPTCADMWEALGLAYQRLGMFTAALKSYGRAVELEDTRVFSLLESGNIFLILGSYRKGVEQFRQALNICPQSISGHYGLASALLGLSKECNSLGAFRWGASLLEEASDVVEESTRLAGNISCLWKLHGDIQLAYAQCYPWLYGDSGTEIQKEAFNKAILTWKSACSVAAISASHCYQRALHLAPSQANIYTDIALASDLIFSLSDNSTDKLDNRQLPEKMSLGGLLLEGDNCEFWVALGCLSNHSGLKQHAFIRGLQLDVSLAIAWAHLGKLYRGEGLKQLAKQAFDSARSIDPFLALPWAGMSAADAYTRESKITPHEAYESCLRAVQILPLADFQIGLVNLALLSDHLSSSQVLGAIQQAVQRAPHYPESHNLNGLVYEARFEYQSAVGCYQLARCALSTSTCSAPKSCLRDISINLARSLCRAGNALDAAKECEILNGEGMLDAQGLQIYSLSLWKLGKTDAALSVVRTLAASVSSMKGASQAVSVSFICILLYNISGQDSTINTILKMPKELFQSSRVSFVVSSIHALDRNNRLDLVVSSSRSNLTSHEDVCRMHCLVALSKLVKSQSEHSLEYEEGVHHLRKVLHLYPTSRSIRNLLGYLLLCSKEWDHAHSAARCGILEHSDSNSQEELKTACEVLAAGTVACYAVGGNQALTFPTCRCQCLFKPQAIQELQKWLHQEPWNDKARYLLILNLMQKAREERFPQHHLSILNRLILEVLSSKSHSPTKTCQYQKFQLLLCASEISLRGGNISGCLSFAKTAAAVLLPNSSLFFAHLLLCVAHAAKDDLVNLLEEYMICLQCKTESCIGWVCLMLIKYQYKLQIDSNSFEMSIQDWLAECKVLQSRWLAVFEFVRGLISLQNQDFHMTKELFEQACSLAVPESCFFLCHGAICMELGRQQCVSQYLSHAVKSLTKSQEVSVVPLPFTSMLLAQAEASLGSKNKWQRHLHFEWFSWPSGMRPAELFFQMHLLAKESMAPSDSPSSAQYCQNPKRWVLCAIHLNPSCLRYWRALQKLNS